MKKRIVVLLTCLATAVASFGCGARSTVELDESKTTLTVGNWNGGVGYEWLEAAIDKFEEKYADTSFEEGKKGVQVVIGSNNKTSMEGETLKDMILQEDVKDEVFFTEGVFYHQWVNKELMLDITEYVEESLTDFDEEKSIADKMDPELLEALKVDGKIYALPFWQGCYCMVYNATLFDENGWYISADGGYTNASGKLGAGPDGQAGTYDDGMPATYEEFFALLSKIKQDNCTPFQMPGAHQDYFAWFISEMAADAMGSEQTKLNYNFNGTANLIKPGTLNYDTMEFETEEVEITPNNAYDLARQPGLAYAVDFAQDLLQNTTYYDMNKSLSGSFKLVQSQLEFVRNPTISSAKNVAIMLDGSWWENEATAAFKETYGTDATKHDADMEYKVMSFPKATADKVGEESVMVNVLDCYGFIKSNIAPEKIEVATKFLQFVHTDALMAEFTEMTSLRKPYNYEIDEEALTPFAKSMFETVDASTIVYPMNDNDLYCYSPTDFRLVKLVTSKYSPELGATDGIADVLTQKTNSKYSYSAQNYLEGILEYRQNEQWPQYKNVLK